MLKPHLLKILCLFFSLTAITVSSNAQSDTSQSAAKLSEYSLEDLMNIKVISSTGFEQTIAEAPSTMVVITAQQIQERGYTQLEDVLRDIAGVDIIHMHGSAPSIFYFRGLYGAENLRTLLMIDGIRENNLSGNIDLAGPAYSLHNIERIEILWGPSSSLYGADAFGGVINIITKKGKDINGLHYEDEMGSFNTRGHRLSVGLGKNEFELTLSGALYSTNGPRFLNRDPLDKGEFVDNARSFDGNLSYTTGGWKSTLGYRSFDTPMSWGLFLNSATKIQGFPSQGYNNSGAVGTLFHDVRSDHPGIYEPFTSTLYLVNTFQVSPKLRLSLDGIYRETGIKEGSYVYLSIDTALGAGIDTVNIYNLPLYNWSNRVRGDASAAYEISEDQKLLLGFEFDQDNLEYGNRTHIPDTNTYTFGNIGFRNLFPTFLPRQYAIRNNIGSYLQYVINTTLLTNTSFTIGARYDRVSDFESPLSPRFAIVSSPFPQFSFKLLYGRAYRAPKILEVQSAKNNLKIDNLSPEQVTTYEVNLSYKPGTEMLLQVNGFYNDLTDIFVLNSLIGGGFQQKQSFGSSTVKGGELRLDVFPSRTISGFANFTYQHGVEKDTTENSFAIPNLPELKANAGLTFHVADMFSFSPIANWVGDRTLPRSNPYGADKNYTMDGYFLMHVNVTTERFLRDRFTAGITINNLLNTVWLDPGIRTADGVLYSTVMEQPGRTFMFKLTIDLGY